MADSKKAWPELVGKTKEEAEAAVKAERPDVTVQLAADGGMTTADFNEKRVWIFYNPEGKVAKEPKTG